MESQQGPTDPWEDYHLDAINRFDAEDDLEPEECGLDPERSPSVQSSSDEDDSSVPGNRSSWTGAPTTPPGFDYEAAAQQLLVDIAALPPASVGDSVHLAPVLATTQAHHLATCLLRPNQGSFSTMTVPLQPRVLVFSREHSVPASPTLGHDSSPTLTHQHAAQEVDSSSQARLRASSNLAAHRGSSQVRSDTTTRSSPSLPGMLRSAHAGKTNLGSGGVMHPPEAASAVVHTWSSWDPRAMIRTLLETHARWGRASGIRVLKWQPKPPSVCIELPVANAEVVVSRSPLPLFSKPPPAPWVSLLMKFSRGFHFGLLPLQRDWPVSQFCDVSPTVFHTWSTQGLTSLGVVAMDSGDDPTQEEECLFDTPTPALPWPSPEHLVDGKRQARRSEDMEPRNLDLMLAAEAAAPAGVGAAESNAAPTPADEAAPGPAILPMEESVPPPPPGQGDNPGADARPPAAPQQPLVHEGQGSADGGEDTDDRTDDYSQEPMDQEEQDDDIQEEDARLSEVQTSRDDVSTATERTANGGDFRLQLPPDHPCPNLAFASEGVAPGAQDSQSQFQTGWNHGRKFNFGIQMALVFQDTTFSPFDMLVAISNMAERDPHMVIAPASNDSSRAVAPHELKALAEIQLMVFFDMQQVQWGNPRDSKPKQKQLASFYIHSDVFRDVRDVMRDQRVSIWSNKTGIQVYPHVLRQSASRKIALLMGIDPLSTNKHGMRKRIEDQVNSHGNTNYAVALIPVNKPVGKKKNVMWAICAGLQDADQVTALLRTKKVPLLSFFFLDQGPDSGLPEKVAAHKQIMSMIRSQRIDNLRPDNAVELRWLFHSGSKLPGKVQNDVVDISEGNQPMEYVLKYVHYSDRQTDILMDVITVELDSIKRGLELGMPEGEHWVPPTMVRGNQPTRQNPGQPNQAPDESDGEDSGRFSLISLTVNTYAAAAAKAAAAVKAAPIPVQVTAAQASGQQGGWTQPKRKRNKAYRQANTVGPTQRFLSQGLCLPVDSQLAVKAELQKLSQAMASTRAPPITGMPPPPRMSGPPPATQNLGDNAPSKAAGSGYESDHSGPSQASSLTNRTGSTNRTLEECEQIIEKMEVAAVQAAKDKAVADSARIAAVMERDALKHELARTQLAMKATEDKVDALQHSTQETNNRINK